MVLQFFDRSTFDNWQDEDLNAYISYDKCMPVVRFLQRIGYRFQPTVQQAVALGEATTDGAMKRLIEQVRNLPSNGPLTTFRGIVDRFEFVRNRKSIQIHACHTCPVHAILQSHSSMFKLSGLYYFF
jgi:hypothetical protein